jgi:predicted nucleic acid-binding protein
MIVVSDTTPLHYLILIDEVDLLPRVLGEIVIPHVVYQELQADKTPSKIKNYLRNSPDWLSIRPATGIVDIRLEGIDPGEREAILLAEELIADAILIDDLAGRKIAESRGIHVIGTLGMLELAAEDGLIDFMDAMARIKAAGFFISSALERDLMEKHDY